MIRNGIAILTLLASTAFAVEPEMATGDLRGYTAQHSTEERAWEKKFQGSPDAGRLRENMRRLTARPHHVGSPYDKDNAEWILAQLKSFGLDAKIEVFDTLFPTPKRRTLELLGPTKFVAKLEEPTLAVDPTSGQKQEQLPTYNAFSADGDVTAPLVHVNYGAPADYERLERLGVSVKGAIVIARYGQTWRGIKPKLAAEHGAVGCIIYSDPKDDGYFEGVSYPQGPTRPAEGVQRGSVMDMPVYPGDPQTPGVGAVPGATLVPLAEVKTITKIPVLPISYEDARPLLESLGGETAPETWRGGLPLTYKVGPSVAKVHLALAFNWDRKPLYNVIARIPGATLPDQWVIRGNHHDAWVNGANDPVAGVSPELEEARGLGELLKQGWKPQRTIVYCFWDGEEPGLLGSTEWAETHAEELSQHAVAYFNSDTNGRGLLRAEGSQSLENFADSVTKDIEDPETHVSVWKRQRLAAISKGTAEERAEIRARADLHLPALGSGSDYTVFLHHLGVSSVNLGFGGEDNGAGQYHSIYDDFYWYTHFSDTDFAYGRALAQTAGTMVMRMADADVIPYQFSDFADTIRTDVNEVKKLADTMRAQAKERNAEIADGTFRVISDPRHPTVAPAVEVIPPYLNFAPLEQAVDDLTAASAEYEKKFRAHGTSAPAAINTQLMQSERVLLDPAGLPGRPWFRNLVNAPGLYTGYGVKTLPAVREAIEQKQWSEVDAQIARTAQSLERYVAVVKQAAKALGDTTQP